MPNYTDPGAVSGSPISVPPAGSKNQKWTVMIFMGADSVDGDLPLEEAVKHDLAEIDCVAGTPTLDVFVEVHRNYGSPERYRFYHDGSVKRKTNGAGTGVASDFALPAFIFDSLSASRPGPHDRTLLILWGHAYNFAFGRSRTRSGIVDALDFHELRSILKNLQANLALVLGGPHNVASQQLDIIGFDACEVATVEMACQLKDFSKYMLASQVGVPIPGWPYDRILDRLAIPQGRLMGPAEFGSYAVRRFCESYGAVDPTSLTMIDLSAAPTLQAHAELLALTLLSAIGDPASRDGILDAFDRAQIAEGRAFVDVAELCVNLMQGSTDKFVIEAARSLGDFLAVSTPVELIGCSETGKGRPLIVEHGRNAGELARLHGISLYAPHVAPDDDTAATQVLYDSFAFAQETRWSTLVRLLLQMS